MAQDNSAHAVAERLLRILSKDEIASLAQSLAQPSGASIADISAALVTLPRYEITRIVLRMARSTIGLLQDVFGCLTSLGASTRTTGCVFVLADPLQAGRASELEFSPQAVGCVSAWRADQDWKPMADSLQTLKSRWHQLSSTLSRILKAAVPIRQQGNIDLVDIYLTPVAPTSCGRMMREVRSI